MDALVEQIDFTDPPGSQLGLAKVVDQFDSILLNQQGGNVFKTGLLIAADPFKWALGHMD